MKNAEDFTYELSFQIRFHSQFDGNQDDTVGSGFKKSNSDDYFITDVLIINIRYILLPGMTL